MKRALDVFGALIGLVVLSPLLVLVALAVWLDSDGPILFRPEVLGLRGRRFRLLKFRSMVDGAADVLRSHPELWKEYQTKLKLRDDPRITRVGHVIRKYSLDELPQLVNVLGGDLSLVGPRVLSELELARYGESQSKILGVMPGLTGLWQVSGRHTVPFERRMELDLFYIDHWSLALDIRIMLKTVPTVIRGSGAG